MENKNFEFIRNTISDNDVVLFMKGRASAPACGFSSMVVMVLQKLGVSFVDIDVLEDSDLRQAIKDFTNWPTIPQLYVKGEFVGGCDIIREMYNNGELATLLKDSRIIS